MLEETIVEKIINMMKEKPLTLSEIMNNLEIKGKYRRNLIDIINKIERISRKKGWKFIIYPAQCKRCGFVFKERIKPPTKCPKCKSQWISEQRYYLKI